MPPGLCARASPTPRRGQGTELAKRSAPSSDPMSPPHMNGDRRGRCVKVKICLGSCEFPEEPTNLWQRWIRLPTIPQMERRGRVREPKPFFDGRLREFRVRVGSVEDVPASRWVVDCHVERGTRDDAGRHDGGGPPVALVDHDFCGAERAKALSRLDRGLFSGDGTDLRLVPEKDV